jgi:hypothetical protein
MKYRKQSRKFFVNSDKLGKLIHLAARDVNKRYTARPLKMLTPLQCELLARELFTAWEEKIIRNPVSHIFTRTGLGHMQVLEHPSKRDYEFDKKYNGKDYTLVWSNRYLYTQISFDEKLRKKVLRKVKQGKDYMQSIVNVKAKLYELTKGNN